MLLFVLLRGYKPPLNNNNNYYYYYYYHHNNNNNVVKVKVKVVKNGCKN